MKKLLFIILLLLLSSCSMKKNNYEMEKNAIEGLEISLFDNEGIKIGHIINLVIKNDIDELVVFPSDSNLSIFLYHENQWQQIDDCNKEENLPDHYHGIQPGDYDTIHVCTDINNTGVPIKLLITISGNIYRGSMEEFELEGVTEEIIKGSIEVELQP